MRPFPWLALVLLAGGLWLRLTWLGEMSNLLHYDEAWYGVNALQLTQAPRLTPFFTENYGRESGWMYWLAPFILALGTRPFSLRLAAMSVGALTLALCYPLGRELLGRRGAPWVLAGAGVFFWSVHMAYLALRAHFFVLVSTLAGLLLLRALRRNRRSAWTSLGLALGGLGYTYFAAYALGALAGLLLVSLALFDRRRQAGAALALAIGAAVYAPMALYLAGHLPAVTRRPSDVLIAGPTELAGNLHAWAAVWLEAADMDSHFNLPGRPILAGPLAVLVLAGVVAGFFLARRRRLWLGLAAWAGMAFLPAVVTTPAPYLARAGGMLVPVAIAAGAGGLLFSRACVRWLRWPGAAWLPMGLVAAAGWNTYTDYAAWLASPSTYMAYERPLNDGLVLAGRLAPPGVPVYFFPFSETHPVLLLRGAELAPRPVSGFTDCLVLSAQPAVYYSLDVFGTPRPQVEVWSDVTPLASEFRPDGNPPRYSLFQAQLRPEWIDPPALAVGEEVFALSVLQAPPPVMAPGSTLSIWLGFQARAPEARQPTYFVHLYGEPTPYQGGQIWAQADAPLCSSHPPATWRPAELMALAINLPLPLDLPPGRYQVAAGLYWPDSGARLLLTGSQAQPEAYALLATVEIVTGGSAP